MINEEVGFTIGVKNRFKRWNFIGHVFKSFKSLVTCGLGGKSLTGQSSFEFAQRLKMFIENDVFKTIKVG
jgi:hypothetical protein